jgi:hypothetical protein
MKKICSILLVILLIAPAAFAVKVSPVRFDLAINRGNSKTFVLNLTGTKGLHNQDLVIYPSDLAMYRNGALSFDSIKVVSIVDSISARVDSLKVKPALEIPIGSLKNSAVKWIKIVTPQVSLLEGKKLPVNFKISVPSNATPGEYYAVIMVEPTKFTVTKDKKEPVKFEIKARVAVVVILNVPGRIYEKKGEALDLETSFLKDDEGVKFTSAFKNSGNIHLDVTSAITVRNDKGVSFGSFPIKAIGSPVEQAFVFPGATRDFEGFLYRPLPSGNYIAEIKYDYGYTFKKATKVKRFTFTRKVPVDETQAFFLSLESGGIDMSLPAFSTRTKVVRIVNNDYRPLTVEIKSDNSLADVNPKNLVLKPGEMRNIQLIIRTVEYVENVQKALLTFKPDRGLSLFMPVTIIKPVAKK